MNLNTKKLHDLGQSLWVDNISREMLVKGTLARYISDYTVTGLTSNPTIFEHAIGHGSFYDEAIARLARRGKPAEELFFTLALEDLTRAADLFRPIFDATEGLDGWVSLEVSPLLSDNATKTIQAASSLHEAADRPNLFIKIPGTPAGAQAIEESIFNGVPVNVTLLFSREQYVVSAEAYMRGIERRLQAGLDPNVRSVASLFVSRWDVAVKQEITPAFHNRLGIAIAMRTYKAYRDLLASPRWLKLDKAGARPQRLLWASTGTKDPAAPDTLYIEALAAPDTINTIPEKTLQAFADHGKADTVLPADGGYAEAVLEEFRREGVDDEALAARLQREGSDAFTVSWQALLARIHEKSEVLGGSGS
ncbi:transaldolase [Candidatus Aalborgicola defluviihabitans]|uniref:transaldolase n=1 Tax=Candidatus Aalborgicola defluviihabitans TaxID=3386187 RepID=UPI001E0C94CC|nr:transaldolase [Burkholderiales bacterium]